MATSKRKTEKQIIENYRVALASTEKQNAISTALAEYGYTTEEIAKGWTLWQNLRDKFDLNKEEDNETRISRKAFDTSVDQLEKIYSPHRKIAKLVFRYNEVARQNLGLTGEIPDAYIPWLENVKTFYVTAQKDESIMAKLLRGKINAETVSSALGLIKELENARTTYLVEIGESQEATRVKDEAFDTLEKWMQEFLGFAKIALVDQPQLLESMGLLVR